MSDEPISFLERLKTMGLEELWSYERAASNTVKVLNVFGVALCFLVLMYPTIVAIGVGSMLLFIASKTVIGVNMTRVAIMERIVKLEDK